MIFARKVLWKVIHVHVLERKGGEKGIMVVVISLFTNFVRLTQPGRPQVYC